MIQYFTAALDATSRDLYRIETLEGIATLRSSRHLPKWKRIVAAYVKNIGFWVTVYTASVYIQLSSRLQPGNLRHLQCLVHCPRVLIMKALMWDVGRRGSIHVRVRYVLTAVPTVMLGTQVRVALLRVKGIVSTTSIVVLALIEPLTRIFKFWRVRREIGQKVMLTRTPTSISPNPVKPMPSRPSDSMRVQSVRVGSMNRRSHIDSGMHKQLLLQFTAAEIHADKCSEYSVIACSLAIFYCLEGHPKFAWPVQANDPSSSVSRVALVVLQIGVEFVVDTVCCMCELGNGIPLRTGRELHRFLLGLFAGCAVTNIGVCCSIYIK